ncbi:MAG: hypothetical protein NT090_04605 [Acidobacteria bacterium]|nr:hypothetical protein [Acidobacteriota bacterium]
MTSYFLEDFCAVFEKHAWPGNRLSIESAPVEIRLHRDASPRSSLQEAREAAEREHLLRALGLTRSP